MVSSLDDFKEKGGSVFNRLGENLKKVTFVVIINEDFIFLDNFKILVNFDIGIRKIFPKNVIISVRNGQKLNSPLSHVLHSLYDSFGLQGNVLNAWAMIIINIFLNLGLFFSFSWLIYWHLNILIVVSHNDGPQ